jgi:ABC-2 type transport system ATP-binding protein
MTAERTPEAAGPPAAIEARGLRRTFGATVAVDGVDLTVPEGVLYGLIGPDGAGKSTLLRMLATVLRPDAGEAAVFGSSVVRDPNRVTSQIGYMSQQFCLYPDLTVAENVEFFARLRGVPKADRRTRAASLLAGLGLADVTTRRAGRLSGGMKQKLMLATTLMHEPRLLLLDEPTTGVDPVSRREFWQILARVRAEGRTVLVATPYMDEAERCTHVAFMDAGTITRRGTPAEVKASLPGRVLEVGAADPRAVLAAITGVEGVRQAHLLGDHVRVLWAGDTTTELANRLAAAGITAAIDEIPADMEAAFSYLAQVAG